jgi:DNA-binding MarR family transcriptional regulator
LADKATARARPARSPEREGPRVIPGGSETPGLDRLIHQPVRLAIVSSLAVNDTLSFADLRSLLDLTDGNLSVHARKLEEEGYVDCDKGFDGRVPRTEYRLTDRGRKALQRYLDHMEALIRSVRTD